MIEYHFVLLYNDVRNEGVRMKARSLSAITLLIILIGSILLGSNIFGIVMLAFAILGYRELFHIKYQDKSKNVATMSLIGYLNLILICLNGIYIHQLRRTNPNFFHILPNMFHVKLKTILLYFLQPLY